MSDVIIYGLAFSSYVRTARITCVEKGIGHELQPIQFRTEEHRKLHPYMRMPILEHGDLVLYESIAICRYIDEAFEGPALQPADPAARAVMTQYVSVLSSYTYFTMIKNYALKYIFSGKDGPNRDEIDAAIPQMNEDMALLDSAYGKSEWLAGDAFSLADVFMAPIINAAASFPEGAEALASYPNLGRALSAFKERESWQRSK